MAEKEDLELLREAKAAVAKKAAAEKAAVEQAEKAKRWAYAAEQEQERLAIIEEASSACCDP
jgi:hypothetical protein